MVPESRAWAAGRKGGELRAWAPGDLFGVAIGVAAGWGLLVLWSADVGWPTRFAGSVVALLVIGFGFLSPARRYLQRTSTAVLSRRLLGRMMLGAALAGVPLIGTWAAVQWAPVWGDQLAGGTGSVKSYTQIASALGAVLGTFLGAVLAAGIGRRWSYVALCLASLGSVVLFYQTNDGFSAWFLATVAVMGGVSAAFYGWLPVYLPELFPTRMRATGQGFCYNFGRIFAAMGALQTGAIMGMFRGGYPQACTTMAAIYLVGLVVIAFAPESSSESFA
jgi:hypothetical protein